MSIQKYEYVYRPSHGCSQLVNVQNKKTNSICNKY